MSTLKTLRQEHSQVLQRIHAIETQQIRTLREALRQHRSYELTTFVEEFSDFVRSALFKHFQVEEEALFPVLEIKVTTPTIQRLLSDHLRITGIFQEYCEHLPDFERSVQLLTDLIEHLDRHVKFEEALYASVTLSDDEVAAIEHRVQRM